MDLLNLSGPIPETTRETATDNATTLWTNALSELALQMTHTTFDTWLRGTALELHDHTATVLCPNEYTREWLATRLDPPITRTLRALTQTADLQIAYSTASLGGSEEHHQ
jgi:chromosomal replication initiation ATPase DnaA